MDIINEKACDFREKDHGPKYFMKGPRCSFGICRLLPGQVYAPHKHNKMEENFYVLEGTPIFIIDGVIHEGEPGDFIHMEPGEAHQIKNPGKEPCVYVINTTPFFPEGDKEMV
ncbi:MAG: cupin domain-containing protein [Eubacteriaceae bacterium]|nr:cupin domain-containing protein [Eubacteriaceae bacterium]